MDLRRWALRRPHAYAVATPAAAQVLTLPVWHSLVQWTPSPRGADLLVVAGDVPTHLGEPIRRTMAALAAPRGLVYLRSSNDHSSAAWHRGLAPVEVAWPWPPAEIAEVVAAAREMLLGGRKPAPIRERGYGSRLGGEPHSSDGGQAGADEMDMSEMPAGRMMADTGPDPDGLALDAVPVNLGPIHAALPLGLHLRLTTQGDRILDAELKGQPPSLEPSEPDQVAARTLAWAATGVALRGLVAHAERLRHAASLAPEQPRAAASLARRAIGEVERTGLFQRSLVGIAPHDGADAADRWHGWVRDALAVLAEEEEIESRPAAPEEAAWESLPDRLRGFEWSRAVDAAWSLRRLPASGVAI